MDPLRYNEYSYKDSDPPYPYNVKDEPLLHPSLKQNHTTTTDVPNPIQNIPNPIQQFPNLTQNVPNPIQNVPNPIQNVPNPIQNVPNPIQNIPNTIPHDPNSLHHIPNSIQNFPNTLNLLNAMQNLQLPQNIPQYGTNDTMGTQGNQIPCGFTENTEEMAPAVNTQDPDTVEDSKEDLKPLIAKMRRRKKARGKVSSYWNKKITDANFPFYGCSICNISFTSLQELDQHVPIHKGRLTSYDLRLKNQRKRKLLKKESKKLKKLSKKLKKEGDTVTHEFEIEIKPEDGYIGNEKATEFADNCKNESDDVASNVNGEFGQENGNTVENKDASDLNEGHGQENENTVEKRDANDLNEEHGQENGNTIENKDASNLNENSNTVEKKDKDIASSFNEGKSVGNGKTKIKKSKVAKGVTKYAGKDEKLEKDDPRLEKLFKCFACQKQFSLGYYLKLHVRSHTDEKPYTCAQCGQSFITASKLGRHNKRIHLAIRYQCRICYRLFTRFEYLVRHFDKNHADQKLDGEPYDFNAIVPYLKELEEQLMQKVENKDVKEPKPETQDWGEVKPDGTHPWGQVKPDDSQGWGQEIKQDDSQDMPIDDYLQPTVNITVEEITVDIEVKKEKEDFDYDEVKDESFHNNDDDDNSKSFAKTNLKDENVSDDEDYFPSNTWAAPAPEPEPVKRPLKRKDFPLQCEFCNKTISTLTYMKVHLRTHTGERPFKCYVCGRGFITSSKMHRHVLTHGDVPPEEEKVESEGVKEDPDKSGDEQEVTVGGKKKGRPSKKKKKKGLQAVKAKKKYQPRPHACPFCNKRFLHADTLRVHQKCHEGETRILKCNFCLEEQPDEETLKSHEATHTGPRPYVCTICSRTYTKKESMVYHKKTHSETDRNTYVCDICSKTFNEQCKLQRHKVSHRTDKFSLRYECPVCAHMFHTRYHAEMHLSTHLKEGTISEHNRNEILAMVLQNARKIPKPGTVLGAPPPEITPSDERSTVCNICGEVFQHFYFLEEHLKSHGSKIAIEDLNKKEEEVKKHVCPVCNKGFKLPYYLKLHSFTHTKEKPFICQQCGKGFITKGKLKRHLESHTGLKKYQCHICYKFFTRPSYQRIHVRTIHGTQDYNFRLDSFGKQFDVYSENSN